MRYKLMIVPEPRNIRVCMDHFTEMCEAERRGILRDIEVLNVEGFMYDYASVAN